MGTPQTGIGPGGRGRSEKTGAHRALPGTTPFLRVVDWKTLADACSTAGADPPKYVVPAPPLYLTPGESGLSSPALVNDEVLVATTRLAAR
jgi:hypothetical protein